MIQLQEYDRELEVFEGRLFEFPIEFVPSYPFEEDISQGSNFMQTRVPAWCDRILLSPTAKTLVSRLLKVFSDKLNKLFLTLMLYIRSHLLIRSSTELLEPTHAWVITR